MFEVRQTNVFEAWLDGLRDHRAAARIANWIVRLQSGLFGDAKFFDGIGELRVDHGPATGSTLSRGTGSSSSCCGGDKSTQQRDIERAPSKWQRSQMKMPKTIPFDASAYLGSPEAQRDLLSDAFETGDARYIANALGVVARARGMSQIAKEAGVTREALYKALSPDGDPKLSTLLGVMRALNVQLTARAG